MQKLQEAQSEDLGSLGDHQGLSISVNYQSKYNNANIF